MYALFKPDLLKLAHTVYHQYELFENGGISVDELSNIQLERLKNTIWPEHPRSSQSMLGRLLNSHGGSFRIRNRPSCCTQRQPPGHSGHRPAGPRPSPGNAGRQTDQTAFNKGTRRSGPLGIRRLERALLRFLDIDPCHGGRDRARQRHHLHHHSRAFTHSEPIRSAHMLPHQCHWFLCSRLSRTARRRV